MAHLGLLCTMIDLYELYIQMGFGVATRLLRDERRFSKLKARLYSEVPNGLAAI